VGAALEIIVENKLYEHVSLYLSMSFPRVLSRKSGANPPKVFSADVSKVGGESDGSWTRPDLAALAVSRGTYVPFMRADLHTFEVKTARGLDVQGAHEASAQGRFGHYAWLVFQSVGLAGRNTIMFDQVLASANSLGVGVITFQDAANTDQWHVDAWPVRTTTDDAVADEFVSSRFDYGLKEKIEKYLKGLMMETVDDGN